ncbi:hypothetical protein HNQ51_001745 [Inhella inkyongensis]|uniref:Uncharacterized protein n=1 Tax=Inhella inkyongensis TaxID=392593 RepID=A0A840S784_9BURK|nr:hypothetical protein [Inhella inkyongensis]MBB5204431.1 hypothetical protein [Inhella inkyongensis]
MKHHIRPRLKRMALKASQALTALAGAALLVPALEGQREALAWLIVGLGLLQAACGDSEAQPASDPTLPALRE